MSDIQPFARIRRAKVLEALLWLKDHNPLYSNITIDRDYIDTWDDEFVPANIVDHVVDCELNSAESSGYVNNLESDNFENDLHHAANEAGADDTGILSGCVYTDSNGSRDHPATKLLAAVHNHKKGFSPDTDAETPLLIYENKGRPIPLSDYQDPHFFPAAFPTLFPFGTGGHIVDRARSRSVSMSIGSWATWALSHHSRRFARHPTFMFLLYDVINRRRAALGYSLLHRTRFWAETHNLVDAITSSELNAAAIELKNTNTCTNKAIFQLQRQIQIVAGPVPHSMARCSAQATHIRALMVSDGMPVLWITLNPSDLRSTLVMELAGMLYEDNGCTTSINEFNRVTATMNPVAVALFFNSVCEGVFNHLLAAGDPKGGLFGPVSTYFGVVETNGRGMLHLHCLVWLRGAHHLSEMRRRLLSEAGYADRMIAFIDNIIKSSVISRHDKETLDAAAPSASLVEPDDVFASKLESDSNAVASKKQLHALRHTPTCFKYGAAKTGECRFGFPRPCIEKTMTTEHGGIIIFRNHPMIVPWNPAFASLMRSNHDINFIPSSEKANSLMHYITNYATKGDSSSTQQVTAAAIARKVTENAALSRDTADPNARAKLINDDKFALRAFNRLAHDREISGPLAASSLLDLPEYYTPSKKLRKLFVFTLREKMLARFFAVPRDPNAREDYVQLQKSRVAPYNMFDNYCWRGPKLAAYCLYEYLKLVDIVRGSRRLDSDVLFDPDHPGHELLAQRPVKHEESSFLVALIGSLSTNELAEDAVSGGHSETDARLNDVGMILLGLFVPWEMLHERLRHLSVSRSLHPEMCWALWCEFATTLQEHLIFVADNIMQLRRSAAEAKLDREQRLAERGQMTEMDADQQEDLGNEDIPIEYMEIDESYALSDSLATVRAVNLARRNWDDMDRLFGADYSLFAQMQYSLHALEESGPSDSHVCFDIDVPELGSRRRYDSGLRSDVDEDTVKNWKLSQKMAISTETGNEVLDFNEDGTANIDDNEFLHSDCLEPVIGDSALIDRTDEPTILSVLPPDSDCITVADHIETILPLNRLQRLLVEEILDHVILRKGGHCMKREDQLLLYVRGEGGVGKSRVVKALEMGFSLLGRRDELALTAPTGCAADNIGGSTIHTSLNLSTYTKKTKGGSLHRAWMKRSALIVDEISMVPLGVLASMNGQLLKRGMESSATALFGGLSLVIVMGDFFQFPPIVGAALWDKPETDVEKDGKALWANFTSVITLTEQMRQRSDPDFHALLGRARTGNLTSADVNNMNAHVAIDLPTSGSLDNVVVVQLNKTRHFINRLQVERFARANNQKIYWFPALHTRNKKDGNDLIQPERLFGEPDGKNTTGPGILLYSKGMPVSLLANQCTPLGIVNGARALLDEVVVHPEATYEMLDPFNVLCSKPAVSVLLRKAGSTKYSFSGLSSDTFPVFPDRSTVVVNKKSVARSQIPATPGFAVTDYKVQGATYTAAVLDLRRGQKASTVMASHRRFCSTYVQLSRLQTFEGLQLLEEIAFSDIDNKPHPGLLLATKDLDNLSDLTLASWTQRFSGRRRVSSR